MIIDSESELLGTPSPLLSMPVMNLPVSRKEFDMDDINSYSNDDSSSSSIMDDDDYYYDDDEEDEKLKLKRLEQKLKQQQQQTDDFSRFDSYEDKVYDDLNQNMNNKNKNNNDNDNIMLDELNNESMINIPKTHKLRKNDAVKIISTPNGKVGIVYQSIPNEDEQLKLKKQQQQKQLTDFENLSTNSKIQPVLTADGKVALLYRGGSSNSGSNNDGTKNSNQGINYENNDNLNINSNRKYEPILNSDLLLKLYNQNPIDNNNNNSIKASDDGFTSTVRTLLPTITSSTTAASMPLEQTTMRTTTSTVEPIFSNTGKVNNDVFEKEEKMPSQRNDEKTNTLVINRPISEVLGIKKNVFLNKFHVVNTDDQAISSIFNSEVNKYSNNPKKEAPANEEYDYDNNQNNVDQPNPDNNEDTIDNNNTADDDNDDNDDVIDENLNNRLHSDSLRTTTPSEKINIDDPEIINLAIIPAFDSELESKLYFNDNNNINNQNNNNNHYNNHNKNNRRNHRKLTDEDYTTIHCAMQAMVAVAAMITIFGVLGAYFKVRILDQIRLMYW